MNVDGWRGRGRRNDIWMECVMTDMKGVKDAVTPDTREWWKKTCCTDQKRKWDKGR